MVLGAGGKKRGEEEHAKAEAGTWEGKGDTEGKTLEGRGGQEAAGGEEHVAGNRAFIASRTFLRRQLMARSSCSSVQRPSVLFAECFTKTGAWGTCTPKLFGEGERRVGREGMKSRASGGLCFPKWVSMQGAGQNGSRFPRPLLGL